MKSSNRYRENSWTTTQVGSYLFLALALAASLLRQQVLIGLAALLLLALYHWAIAPAFRFRKIPGPPFRPFVGNLPELADTQINEAVCRWSAQYGPLYRFFLGPEPVVVLADPELFKHVAVTSFYDFHDRRSPQSVETAPVGLIFSQGAYWSGARSAVMPLFHTNRLEAYAPAMHDALRKLQNRLADAAKKREPVEINQLTQQLGLDIIGKAAFAVDFEAQTDGASSPLVAAANRVVEAFKVGGGAPLETVLGLFLPRAAQDCASWLLQLIPGTLERSGYLNRKFLMDVAERTGNEKRTRGDNDVMQSSDFLTYLARTARIKDSGRKLTNRQIRAIAMEVVLAGSDTTAVTLAMAVYFLSFHAGARAKVYEEVDRNADAGRTEPGYTDLVNYPYVEQVVKETMRLFAITMPLMRVASVDSTVGGVRIPAGTQLWLATEAVHQNPLHFPEPEEFRPERFDPQSPEQIKRHPYAYLPFGLGPRMCVGFKFAMEEAQLTLITLYRNFRFEPRPETPMWPIKRWAALVVKPAEDLVFDVYAR